MQCADLVVHQRDQWRNHQANPSPGLLAHDGGDLVAQRLAPARGHQHQRIAPIGNMLHDVGLRPAKVGVTKHVLQDGMALVERYGGCCHYKNRSISRTFGGRYSGFLI